MLNNYNDAVDTIQAPEDLKERTAQMMKYPSQTQRHKIPVAKAVTCLAAVAIIVLGVMVVPKILKPVVAVSPAAQDSSTASTVNTFDKETEQKIKIEETMLQSGQISWHVEDPEKPESEQHIATMMEMSSKVVGDNIDKVTYSVNKGKFQKTVRLPDNIFDSKISIYPEYSKAHGLDPNFFTSVHMNAQGNPIGGTYVENGYYNRFGYEELQSSSYTINYEDQADFAKMYGYRVTTPKSGSWLDEFKKVLDSTTLTITAHFKDGTTATKKMKLAMHKVNICVIAVEKSTPTPSEESSKISIPKEPEQGIVTNK